MHFVGSIFEKCSFDDLLHFIRNQVYFELNNVIYLYVVINNLLSSLSYIFYVSIFYFGNDCKLSFFLLKHDLKLVYKMILSDTFHVPLL